MTRTLLVTGGAGFIGSRVVESARAAGWRVRVLDSLRSDVHSATATRAPGADFVHGDVTDPHTVAEAVAGVDAVSHQAAKVGLGVDFSDAADYTHTNVTGTAVLLEAMRRARVPRLVLASSMVVYGEGAYRDRLGPVAAPPRHPDDLAAGRFEPRSPRTGEPLEPVTLDEDAPLDPRNVYALTKLAQEHLAQTWARETGAVAAILRYHNVYGPGMPQATPYAGVASIFRSSLERGEAPQVFEDGRQRRDFIHVADIARANLAALDWTAPGEAGRSRAFTVATGEPHTIGEMAAALSAAMGGPEPVITGRFRLGDVRHITAGAERIRAELHWRPEIGFAEGMREFAHAPLRPAAHTAGGAVAEPAAAERLA